MKIALASYEYPGVTTNCGGGGKVMQTLYRALQAGGHDVELLTDQSDGQWYTYPVRMYNSTKQVLKRIDPDVIHAGFSLPTAVPFAHHSDRLDIPLIVTVMGADVYDPTRFQLIRPAADLANQFVFRKASAVVSPSSDLARHTPVQTTRLIEHAIDTEKFTHQECQTTTQTHIISVGRLIERKNYHTAIDAVECLRARGYEVRYTIAGTGPLRPELNSRAHNTPWLRTPGYIDGISDFYASGDLFLLPSEHEGFGLVYLEALASGLPVVAGDRGGHRDIFRQADRHGQKIGYLATPEPQAVADRLEQVCANIEEYQPSREWVKQHYDSSRMVSEYEAVYQEVVQ